MLQPGSMAMKREDAMRLLGDLGEVPGRLNQLRDGLPTLLAEEGGATLPQGEQSAPGSGPALGESAEILMARWPMGKPRCTSGGIEGYLL
jgi:hypothetical protein